MRFSYFLLNAACIVFLWGIGQIAIADENTTSDTSESTAPPDIVEKDRQLREMQERDRQETLRRQEAQKLRGEQLLREEEERRQRVKQAREDAIKAVDPLLRAAWLAYSDYHHRDRQKVEQMFEEYLEKNPDSPFASEIYYRIGSMYSNNMNPRIGETFDRQKRDEFFTKALKGYKELFSVEADVARSALVSRPSLPLEVRLAYYDWLVGFEGKNDLNLVYSVQPIGVHVTYGEPPEQTEEQRNHRVASLQRFLEIAIPAAETNFILRLVKSPDELARIAERYPDRRLGELARQRLDQSHQKALD